MFLIYPGQEHVSDTVLICSCPSKTCCFLMQMLRSPPIQPSLKLFKQVYICNSILVGIFMTIQEKRWLHILLALWTECFCFSGCTPVQYSHQPTNGVIYFKALSSINSLQEDLKISIPLFCFVITRSVCRLGVLYVHDNTSVCNVGTRKHQFHERNGAFGAVLHSYNGGVQDFLASCLATEGTYPSERGKSDLFSVPPYLWSTTQLHGCVTTHWNKTFIRPLTSIVNVFLWKELQLYCCQHGYNYYVNEQWTT